jgi:RNA polymerase sigma-B factor
LTVATTTAPNRSPFSAEERVDDMLLRRYRERGDRHAREQLVERLMPMVHRLARMYPAHEHADDVVQVAALGLAKAIDRYDPERGVPLRGYAVPTILGEIRRYRRDHCWAVRPPRRLQERILKVTRCVEHLTARDGHSPSASVVAGELGETEEDVVEALVAGRAYLADSLDAPAFFQDPEAGATLGDSMGVSDDGYDRSEYRELLESLRDELGREDWAVLQLRFAADWTQEEIGKAFGVSQMTISRRQRAALEKLRQRLGRDTALLEELGLIPAEVETSPREGDALPEVALA